MRRVFVVLSPFTGDNLALNQVFGMTESFGHDFFCPLCYCSREESQTKFTEREFVCRNKALYDWDIANLLSRSAHQIHIKGIKKFCLLNRLKFFHIMENWINDCMHTVLQGT